MKTTPADLVLDARAELGEGPIWDPKRERLFWVDIRGSAVHEYNPADGKDRVMNVPKHIGCFVLRADGNALVALQDGIYEMDIDTGNVKPVYCPQPKRNDILFNDGKCDLAGRFWVGTKAYADTVGAGSLYCMDTDRTVSVKISGVTVSNGLAWSLDNRRMYYIDTFALEISVFEYNLESGVVKNRRTAVAIPKSMGWADGMSIDQEGKLWVALWQGKCVARFDPDTGECLKKITVPVSCPSSCCFGGQNLDELYITSAWTELDEERRKKEPLAGGLFRAHPGVRGFPPFYFRG